jgi:hypothetical protein
VLLPFLAFRSSHDQTTFVCPRLAHALFLTLLSATIDALRLLMPIVQGRLEQIHLTRINLGGSDRLLQTAIAAAGSRLKVLILDECDDHRGGFNNIWQTLRAANARLQVFRFELHSDHGGLALTQLYEGLSHYLLWNTEMTDVRVMARDNPMQAGGGRSPSFFTLSCCTVQEEVRAVLEGHGASLARQHQTDHFAPWTARHDHGATNGGRQCSPPGRL